MSVRDGSGVRDQVAHRTGPEAAPTAAGEAATAPPGRRRRRRRGAGRIGVVDRQGGPVAEAAEAEQGGLCLRARPENAEGPACGVQAGPSVRSGG
ncbi:hypothetical protein [Streptacidiphilus rugosus]|uniref:hypothetical protein n=1 Tax=Streptacidiphilus rugosus TaxID=405783 RepID=UPI000AC0520C|nr:hypothetical protein [Streptacidiphilus rugosus]